MSANRIVSAEHVQSYRFRVAQESAPRPVPGPPQNGQSESRPAGAGPLEIEREAFEKGHAAGERAGMELAQKKIEAILRRYAQSLRQLASLREELIRRSEQDLVGLSIEIARRLVHREISLDPKIIHTLVRVALEKLNVDSKVTIHLHPIDCQIIREGLEEGFFENQDIEIELRPRSGLTRGDCLIESEYGHVDARIPEQFKEIEKGLMGF